jgi:effector-binding domain-containing protein/uncharacterized protein YndB with AHSA1/START domain
MKIVKYLFFLILIVVVGITLFAATKNGKFQLEESVIIKAPPEVIFNNINDYKNWEAWGPWKDEDPSMTFRYAEVTSGVGASYSWVGKDGEGEMHTVSVLPNLEIAQELIFKTPIGDSKSTVYWTFEEQDNGSSTKVSWGMAGKQSLIEKIIFLFQEQSLEESIRPMYQKGLSTLQNLIHIEVAKYSIKVNGVTDYGGTYYMYVTASTNQNAVVQKSQEMFPLIRKYMSSEEIPITGMPLVIYNQIDKENETAIISAGIPVAERVIVPWNNDVLCTKINATKVLKTTLKGNYSNLEEAWSETYAYMAKMELTPTWNSEAFQVYVTDPALVKNPAAWVTYLYIPIK